mgnify:CR=1 FL=1
MSTNLVRTTTYFDPNLLNRAKKQAIDEGKSLYELINEALQQKLLNKQMGTMRTTINRLNLSKIFPTYKLGLMSARIRRSDAYEL